MLNVDTKPHICEDDSNNTEKTCQEKYKSVTTSNIQNYQSKVFVQEGSSKINNNDTAMFKGLNSILAIRKVLNTPIPC